MNNPICLLSGVTGQAGSYLAEILLKKGWFVNGIIRRASNFNTNRINHLMNNKNFKLHYGDLADELSIYRLIEKIKPDYFINAGAMSHVKVSFEMPIYTLDVTGVSVFKILESIRIIDKHIKFIQFSSSELFGNCADTQNENTPFNPQSPYAIAKLIGYWATKHYREAYNMWATNCIFFNMESPRRGHTFVTMKIIDYVKKIRDNIPVEPLKLGNLSAQRDWGYCKEYMECLYDVMMLKDSDDFIFATGSTHSVKKFCEIAFKEIGITLFWIGEKGIDIKTNKILIEIDERLFRPLEVPFLMGDSSKLQKTINWRPKVDFYNLIKIMLNGDNEDSSKM